MNHLYNMEMMADTMNSVFEHFTHNDFFDAAAYMDFELIDLVIEVLEENFLDADGLISWWMYETRYGTKENMRVVYIGDKAYDLDSPEILYDFLTVK